jgi:hypothetical protein
MSDLNIQLLSSSTMTVQQINTSEDHSDIDHVGLTAQQTYKIQYTGLFNSYVLSRFGFVAGLPAYGEYFIDADSEILFVSHVSAKKEPGAVADATTNQQAYYIVTYSPLTSQRMDLSPLDRPPLRSGSGSKLTEVRAYDVNKKGIVNAVGDFYENLPAQYIPGGEVTITRNEASDPSAVCSAYSNTINTNAFGSIPALAGIFGDITYDEIIENYSGEQITYFRTHYPIRRRNDKDGWNFVPINYGWKYKNAGKVYAVGAGGPGDPSPGIHGPVFLAADGTLLNPDGTGKPTAPIVFPTGTGGAPDGYQFITDTDWNALGLPTF